MPLSVTRGGVFWDSFEIASNDLWKEGRWLITSGNGRNIALGQNFLRIYRQSKLVIGEGINPGPNHLPMSLINSWLGQWADGWWELNVTPITADVWMASKPRPNPFYVRTKMRLLWVQKQPYHQLPPNRLTEKKHSKWHPVHAQGALWHLLNYLI